VDSSLQLPPTPSTPIVVCFVPSSFDQVASQGETLSSAPILFPFLSFQKRFFQIKRVHGPDRSPSICVSMCFFFLVRQLLPHAFYTPGRRSSLDPLGLVGLPTADPRILFFSCKYSIISSFQLFFLFQFFAQAFSLFPLLPRPFV